LNQIIELKLLVKTFVDIFNAVFAKYHESIEIHTSYLEDGCLVVDRPTTRPLPIELGHGETLLRLRCWVGSGQMTGPSGICPAILRSGEISNCANRTKLLLNKHLATSTSGWLVGATRPLARDRSAENFVEIQQTQSPFYIECFKTFASFQIHWNRQ